MWRTLPDAVCINKHTIWPRSCTCSYLHLSPCLQCVDALLTPLFPAVADPHFADEVLPLSEALLLPEKTLHLQESLCWAVRLGAYQGKAWGWCKSQMMKNLQLCSLHHDPRCQRHPQVEEQRSSDQSVTLHFDLLFFLQMPGRERENMFYLVRGWGDIEKQSNLYRGILPNSKQQKII